MNINKTKVVYTSFIILLTILFNSYSKNNNIQFGIKVMFGGRYDNMRMCVASDTGVKGGIIADVMFLTKIQLSENKNLNIEIPVMRPILFAAAFKMLQFEPEITFEFNKKINDKITFTGGPGLGISFHYGPDYHSDLKNKGKSFFAVGPMISSLAGIKINNSENKSRLIGIRAFYIPLFAKNNQLSPGTVLGGVIEGQFDFK